MLNSYILIGGTICLIVALIEAWVILVRFSSETGPVAKIVPGGRDLLRSHIDYLMMAQFLFIFFGLARISGLQYSAWIVGALCFGSFFNPFGFLVRALRPSYLEAPPKIFLSLMITSCVATTLGFSAAAITLVRAALSH
jgi:hypothetical protein